MPTIEIQRIQYGPCHRMAPHIDACRRLSIVLAGKVRERHGRRIVHSTAGSIALKSPDLVHDNEFGPQGAQILSVILPDSTLETLGLPRDLPAWSWQHYDTPRRTVLHLATAAIRGEALAVEESLAELLGDFDSRGIDHEPKNAHKNLEAIRTRLHCDPSLEVSLRDLAHEAGLHPVTLGQYFRRAYGCSITTYRQRLRAERAALALAAPTPPLTQVALEQGFYDLSHLTRVFRREFGCPPGEYRRRLAMRGESGAGLQSSKTSWSIDL